MSSTFAQALHKSTDRFSRLIEPDLREVMGGEFMAVEGDNHPLAKALDMYSGIDIIHISDKGIKGIGSRIQTSDKCWETFTFRKARESGADTEYKKRKHSIENGFIYPELTLQAYVNNNDELLGYAVVKTQDLLKLIDDGHHHIQHTGFNQKGQASFYVVKWDNFRQNDLPIFIREFE